MTRGLKLIKLALVSGTATLALALSPAALAATTFERRDVT